jgi:hypothetical protein
LPLPEGPTKMTNSPSADVEIDVADDVDRAERLFHVLELDDGHV